MSKKRPLDLPPIVIIDTCIFLEILNVPGFSSHRNEIIAKNRDFIKQGASFFLPMTVILETGNHIANVTNGQARRAAAERFVEQIKGALSGDAPWRPTPFPDKEEILGWIDNFADRVMKGPGFGDQTILHLWEKSCRDFPNRRVLIWTHDNDLAGCDRIP